MITPKIKALFHFIEYLNSNIDSFNLNNDLIKELELLFEERQKVRSKKTFKDKLKYDEVQAEIETKFDILQGKTANLIKEKAKELNVCNFDNVPNYSFNGIETDIRQLKENFSKDDLPEIFKHKQQYIEYRKKTHKTFFSLAVFIDELDEITKSLFDYFKETEQNEFEAFESKAIQGNDIGEAVKLSQSGKFQKFPSPNSFLNPSTIQQQPNIEPLPPQPISVNESRTKKVIFETITNIDKQGWQYAFVSEQDFNLFTDLLTNFFEYKPYALPETIIQLKRTCKTKVAKALGEIHKELSNENKLTTDTKYFQLIRVLSHFEKETEGDLYKALTR